MFSAGEDVTALASGERTSFRRHLERTYNRLIRQMRGLEKPIVGAINGAAAGAGLGRPRQPTYGSRPAAPVSSSVSSHLD